MPTYRGVEAEDIADSIEAAQAFVNYLKDVEDARPPVEQNPESKGWVRRLFSSKAREPAFSFGPYKFDILVDDLSRITPEEVEAIRHANSDKVLVALMDGLTGRFLFMHKLFRAHGALDTNEQGAQLYRELDAWGPFEGARTLVYEETDGAIEEHLKNYPEPTREQLVALSETLQPSYIQRYGVVYEDFDHKALEDFAAELDHDSSPDDDSGKLLHRVYKVLEKFEKSDELCGFGCGWFGAEGNRKCGIVFEAPLEAAQAVAAALPEYQVMSYVGARIQAPGADGQAVEVSEPEPEPVV